MFNAENLLGKIVGEVLSSSNKKSPMGGLGSGSTLMTLIGLGVGAFEILAQQGQQGAAGGVNHQTPPPGSTPPPPPSGSTATPPSPPPAPRVSPAETPATASTGLSANELAVRLIQVMAAAANADGRVDAREEQIFLEKLQGTDLSAEEKNFLVDALHQPKSVDELAQDISDPATAKGFYVMALTTITVDTPAERAWLDSLAGCLGISPALQKFLEEQHS